MHGRAEPATASPEEVSATPATVTEPSAAPAALTPAAILRLQRSAGNAAVGRLLGRAPGAAVSRQPATETPPALKQTYYYDRSHFKERYDGLLDRATGRITLIMKVNFELAPEFVNRSTGEFDAKTLAYYEYFKKGFKEVVERIWSGAHALKPAMPLDRNFQYETRVRVEFSSSDAHADVRLYPRTIDASTGEAARSCASAAKPGERGVALLQEGDNVEKEHTMEYKGEKLTFYGNTSAHEFGHLLGLDHINQKAQVRKKASGEWTDEDRYGVTPEQAVDIMGRGTVVGPRNMGPFIRIAEEYYKEIAAGHPEFNKWTVVDSG